MFGAPPPANPVRDTNRQNFGRVKIYGDWYQWRYIPKDLSPKSTLHDYLDLWNYDGTLSKIHHLLYMLCRERVGREPSPAAGVIDSQSVKSAEKGRPASIRMAMMQAKN